MYLVPTNKRKQGRGWIDQHWIEDMDKVHQWVIFSDATSAQIWVGGQGRGGIFFFIDELIEVLSLYAPTSLALKLNLMDKNKQYTYYSRKTLMRIKNRKDTSCIRGKYFEQICWYTLRETIL